MAKVVFLRKLPIQLTENELLILGKQFGDVVNVLKIQGKDQGFIEFADASSAQDMVVHNNQNPITFGSKAIAIDFSQHPTIQKRTPANSPGIASKGISNLPISTSPVLLVNIQHANRPIDADQLCHVFSQYGGTVLRIILFDRNGNTNALVEFQNSAEANLAKSVLDGQHLFHDGGILKISTSNMQKLAVSQDTKNARDYARVGMPIGTFVPQIPQSISIPHQPMGATVLHVSNLDEEKVTPVALFKLFGVYGDVLRVKILYRNRSQAILQFRDSEQCMTALRFLNNTPLFGKMMHVHISKNLDVNMGTNDPLTQDFSTSPLHRYKVPGSKNFSHITAVSPALHVSNLPEGVRKEEIESLFAQFGKVESFEFFPNTTKMGVCVLDTVDNAIIALIQLHGENVFRDQTNNRGVIISFSARRRVG